MQTVSTPGSGRFANRLFDDPSDGFGIWHIHGMRRYPRSIRLGLSHYMGSVQRARYFLKFPERAHPACYVYTHKVDDTSGAGKLFFLEGVGIKRVKADYDEIYDRPSREPKPYNVSRCLLRKADCHYYAA